MFVEFKALVQKCAGQMGYRIVPRDRDAQTLMRYVERLPINVVIDTGANAGHTCIHWLKAFPSAHVHAIEPLERFRPALERVARAFPGRLTIWPVAATDCQGELTFYVHDEHPSSSSLRQSTDKSHELLPFTERKTAIVVRGARLDELFVSSGIKIGRGVLLKLDVQGAELEALRGCEGFLANAICVLCEINLTSLYDGQPNLADIIAFLRPFGLEFCGVTEQFHAADGRPIYLDAVFMRELSD